MMRPAPSSGEHRPQCGAAHDVKAIEIDTSDAIPFLYRKLVDGDAVRQCVDTGIVDENVEAAIPFHNRRDGVVYRCGEADVDCTGRSLFQFRCDAFGAFAIDVRNDDRGPVVGQPPRD